MFFDLKRILKKILTAVRLWPLSLAEKCRFAFGGAVLLVLALSLVWPYLWMGKLTKKACLDTVRLEAKSLLRTHFRPVEAVETALSPLDEMGRPLETSARRPEWILFEDDPAKEIQKLSSQHSEVLLELLDDSNRLEQLVLEGTGSAMTSRYYRLWRATEGCVTCHNPQGTAKALALNQPVGAVIVQRPAGQVGETLFMNRLWIVAAGLIGGAGAIVVFYVITQRVIFRPIRQLRAIANNVADGNLETRSAIKTGDEYEKLASAFNHMLDGLQAAQDKLRQANRQLDAKIAELSERNIELFKANKIKNEFLANVSHEFRTPLNAILGFAEILRDNPLLLSRNKAKRYAENIVTAGGRLLNMVNDLLDLAKTEAGKVRLHLAAVGLDKLCRQIASQFSEIARRKKINIRLDVEKGIPEVVTDGGKVQQILYNFLSNAVKFTPEKGRIEIRALTSGEKTVRIEVSDTGCGISSEDQEKIFEKFRQAETALTRGPDGSGLGLAISRELASMLAGTIGLESEPGSGSTFWLEIPVSVAAEPGQ